MFCELSEAMNDTNDDEASDPEFNILDELEMEKTDLFEEMRSDRAVNISSMYCHMKVIFCSKVINVSFVNDVNNLNDIVYA